MKFSRQIGLVFLMIILSVFLSSKSFGASNNKDVDTYVNSAHPDYNYRHYRYGSNKEDVFNAIDQTNDGGYISAGYISAGDMEVSSGFSGKTDGYVLKVDKNFKKEWDFSYGDDKAEVINDVVQLSNGEYVAVGSVDWKSSPYGDSFIIKLDSKGNLVWEKRIGTAGKQDSFDNVIQLNNGTILVSGRDGATYEGYVANYDIDGNVLWENKHGGFIFDMLQTDSGKIYIGGDAGKSDPNIDGPVLGNQDAFVIELDENGNKKSEKTYGFRGANVHVYAMAVDGDNNLLIGLKGFSTSTSSFNYFIKLDPNYNLLFKTQEGGARYDINRILVNKDGTYTILSNPSTTTSKSSYISNYKKDGTFLYSDTFIESGNSPNKYKSSFNDIIINKEGRKVLVGGNYGYAIRDNDGELVQQSAYNNSQDGVIVIEDYKPTLSSKDEIAVHYSDVKTDDELISLFNAKGIDPEEGDITNLISVDQKSVGYYKVGKYEVTLKLLDNSNAVTQNIKDIWLNKVIKKVKVNIINDKPIITADSEEYSSVGKVLSDEELKALFNVKANDYEDGDLYSSVVVDSSAVDFNKVGDYNITFTVSDALGETATITVILHITNEKPVINADDKHQGHINEVISDDDLLKLFNVSASDLEDGDLTSKVTIDSSAVDFNTEGTYEIVLTVTDSDGNKVEKKVNIEIVADMNPELNSDDYKEVEEGNPLSDDEIKQLFNVSASDYEDGDLTSNVVVDQSKVDYNTPGEYEIKFYIIDSYGNKVEKIVTLKVTKRSIPTKPSKPISPDKPTDSVDSNDLDNSNDSKEKDKVNSKKDRLIQSGKNSKLIISVMILIIFLLMVKIKTFLIGKIRIIGII